MFFVGRIEVFCRFFCFRRFRGEYIIRFFVIISSNLSRILGFLFFNLFYKFILLKKLKMLFFCESCINELFFRMIEGGKEGEVLRGYFLS